MLNIFVLLALNFFIQHGEAIQSTEVPFENIFVTNIEWEKLPPKIEASYEEGCGSIRIFFPSGKYYSFAGTFHKNLGEDKYSIYPRHLIINVGEWKFSKKGRSIVIKYKWLDGGSIAIDGIHSNKEKIDTCTLDLEDKDYYPRKLFCTGDVFINDPQLKLESVHKIIMIAEATEKRKEENR